MRNFAVPAILHVEHVRHSITERDKNILWSEGGSLALVAGHYILKPKGEA